MCSEARDQCGNNQQGQSDGDAKKRNLLLAQRKRVATSRRRCLKRLVLHKGVRKRRVCPAELYEIVDIAGRRVAGIVHERSCPVPLRGMMIHSTPTPEVPYWTPQSPACRDRRLSLQTLVLHQSRAACRGCGAQHHTELNPKPTWAGSPQTTLWSRLCRCKRIVRAAPAGRCLDQDAALYQIFDVTQRRIGRAFGDLRPF